ncbi:hypothetical protein MKEN_00815100 [Mycena kentingensis (nom. inval.)]|nr:hypothetical protein MKEN_00815100 [Mycena kentingensis (nom. inval.)]
MFSSFTTLPEPNHNHRPIIPQKDKRRNRDKRPVTPETTTSRSFYEDRRGDPLNIQYGKLDTRDVPKYHPNGRVILGLSGAFQAHRTNGGIEIALRGGRRQLPKLSDASSRALLLRIPTRSFVHASSSKYEEQGGFLRLPSRSVPSRDAYREIERQNANSDSDSASHSESSQEETTPTAHDYALQSINTKLAADSTNIANWESLLAHNLSTIPRTSKNSTRARSEISISILARALTATGRPPALLVKFLECGEEVWHESKLRAEWEDALKHQRNIQVWLAWLDWRWRSCKTGIASFVADAERALVALQHDDVGQVILFWRLAVAFKSAGYWEKATAMFQAQAEMTFHLPQGLAGLPLDRVLNALEQFWEAECPRFGENDSLGWAVWLSAGRPVGQIQARGSTLSVEDLDPYRKFAFTESVADRTQFLPRRSIDPETETDPYTLILFTDIRNVLFSLQSENAKNVFRYAWLSLLGLNVPGFPAAFLPTSGSEVLDRSLPDHLLRPASLNRLFPPSENRSRITNDAFAGTTIGRERDYSDGFDCPVLHWGWNQIAPFGVPRSDAKAKAIWTAADLDDVDPVFVGHLFRLLRQPNDTLWDSYALAFAGASSLKSAVQLSRGFLSASPDSLEHWATHARLEQLRGKPADARKVYETVLLSSPPRRGAEQLWYDWAEMEWLGGAGDASVRVILLSVGVEGAGGVALLRAKRALDDAIKTTDTRAFEAWIKLRAMLELLAGGGPEGAIEVFESAPSRENESLVMAKLLMLYRHSVALRNPMAPALLRDRVETAIVKYPDNSVLLGLFLETQRGQGMWGRVRSRLGEESKSIWQRFQDIWIARWDKSRWEAEMERSRWGLVVALDNERTRHSPILWRLAVEFEIRCQGNLMRAKQLWFRAIGDCPLDKGLYLLAFSSLRSVFTAAELNGVADTMAERMIRLRKGLEDIETVVHFNPNTWRHMASHHGMRLIRLAPCSDHAPAAYLPARAIRPFSSSPSLFHFLLPRRPHRRLQHLPRLHLPNKSSLICPLPFLRLQRTRIGRTQTLTLRTPPIHAPTDKDDDAEDWDIEMDLGATGKTAAQVTSAPAASQAFIIRPRPQSLPDIDDDDDEGVSTIKVAVFPKTPLAKPPRSPIDEDFEDAFSLPNDLTQLSLAPLSLSHRVSKTSLEWGDKDQTSSSQSSDAYSSLGFADASPSSNSTSSVSLPGTEDDDDDEELDGLVIPVGIFESGKGARHLTKLLEMKKKAPVADSNLPVSRPDAEDDFETGLIIDDDFELSPSRLLNKQQSHRAHNARSNSLPIQRQTTSLRPSSRLRPDRAKSPVISRPPTRSQGSLSPTGPTSFLSPRSGNLRGQKSHSGLKPPSPPANPRKLSRKASLSSLMETSSNQASGSGSVSGASSKGYEISTAASRAKSFKGKEYKVPPTRPSTPSANPAALRLTMPTSMRSKSRPALSSVFHGQASASGSQSPLFRSNSPLPPRPPSHLANARRPSPTPPPPTSSRPAAPRILKRPKRQRLFGDGTELDAFDDLPTDREKESRYRVQPKGHGNRIPGGTYSKGTIRRKRREGSDGGSFDAQLPLGPSNKLASSLELSPKTDAPRKKKQNSSPTVSSRKKPTLIRNLGGAGAPRVVGDMKWNPHTLRWEGNEHVLRDFDAAVGTSTRPALITHLTGSSIGSPVGSFANGARIVGNMIFDPARMCWISTLPPDEDEPDVFANLADDEDDDAVWESKGGTIRANLQLGSSTSTATPSATSSPARSESYVRGASESDSERGSRASLLFDVDETFLASCRAAEERHRTEMRGWNMSTRSDPFADPDRSYLYEIRELATRKYS